jgi:putative protease
MKKVVKKKIVKKTGKKSPAKKAAVKSSKKKAVAEKTQQKLKPVGVVTHYFAEIEVAIVKFKEQVSVGAEVGFRGATTDFNQKISSMQFDHKPVEIAKKGKEMGIKVSKRVREGDSVFLIQA